MNEKKQNQSQRKKEEKGGDRKFGVTGFKFDLKILGLSDNRLKMFSNKIVKGKAVNNVPRKF